MPSLVELLAEASSRDASEVVMETGQPVMLSTPAGAVSLGSPMSEDDLFGALTSVLSEEQQVELAVGNVVEFEVNAKTDWHVLTKPGSDGISVRARVSGSSASASQSGMRPAIELPPVAPFTGAASTLPPAPEDSFSQFPVEREDSGASASLAEEFAGSGLSADYSGSMPPPAASDSFADSTRATRDLGPRGDPDPPNHPPEIELPPANDEISLDDEVPLEVSVDEEDVPLEVDFGLVGETQTGEVPSADVIQARKRSNSSTRLGLARPATAAYADTRSDLASVKDTAPPVSGTFDEVAAQVPRSGVCFVHHVDPKKVVARLGVKYVKVGPGSDPAAAATSLYALMQGACAVLEVEDPSVWLGWVLRRVEEGYFVLVATRALTAGGAKRVMLGTSATVRTESWLSRHTVRSLIETEGIWSLTLPH